MFFAEYRVPLPLRLDEFPRGNRYLHVRHTALVHESSENAEKVTLLERTPIPAGSPVPDVVAKHGRVPSRHQHFQIGGGVFTKNSIDLGQRLPRWLSPFLKAEWTTVQENYWNLIEATGYSFCTYTHPAIDASLGWHYHIESVHCAEASTRADQIARREDIFTEMTDAEKKARAVIYVDITEPLPDSVTGGVFHGDCSKMAKCGRTGRFPIPKTTEMQHEFESSGKVHWWQQLTREHGLDGDNKQGKPVSLMTIYKQAKIVSNLPFSEKLAAAVAKSTIQDLAQHAFANLTFWATDRSTKVAPWLDLTMDDIAALEKSGWHEH